MKRGAPLQRTGRLRHRSRKTETLYRTQRRPLVAELFADGPTICPVPWCSNVADSPHEPLTRARGGSITDPTNVVLICHQHNQELTEEPAWGYELGLLRHSWDVDNTRDCLPSPAPGRVPS